MATKLGKIVTNLIQLTAILNLSRLITAEDGCPYPCLPPPIGGTTTPQTPPSTQTGYNYPPPDTQTGYNYPPPDTQTGYNYPPPSAGNSPPLSGDFPNYSPPSGYSGDGGSSGGGNGNGGTAPPPPDPILPYFPYYYKNGLHGQGSSSSSTTGPGSMARIIMGGVTVSYLIHMFLMS